MALRDEDLKNIEFQLDKGPDGVYATPLRVVDDEEV